MPYKIAGIDVHKRMLAVVVSDVEVEGEYHFERRQFGSNPAQLRSLAEWLIGREVEEVVMESTAQYSGEIPGVAHSGPHDAVHLPEMGKHVQPPAVLSGNFRGSRALPRHLLLRCQLAF